MGSTMASKSRQAAQDGMLWEERNYFSGNELLGLEPVPNPNPNPMQPRTRPALGKKLKSEPVPLIHVFGIEAFRGFRLQFSAPQALRQKHTFFSRSHSFQDFIEST